MNLLTFAWGAKVFSFNLPQVFGSNKNFRHMVWQYKVVGSMYNGMKSYLKEHICLFLWTHLYKYPCWDDSFMSYQTIPKSSILLSNGSLGWVKIDLP